MYDLMSYTHLVSGIPLGFFQLSQDSRHVQCSVPHEVRHLRQSTSSASWPGPAPSHTAHTVPVTTAGDTWEDTRNCVREYGVVTTTGDTQGDTLDRVHKYAVDAQELV